MSIKIDEKALKAARREYERRRLEPCPPHVMRSILYAYLSALTGEGDDVVERAAKIIDPEAFGLPANEDGGSISDRDIARDRARILLSAGLLRAPEGAPGYAPATKIGIAAEVENFLERAEANTSAPKIDAAAKEVAAWIGYSWDGLYDRRIGGFPQWVSGRYQGGKEDIRDLVRSIERHLSRAPASKQEVEVSAPQMTQERAFKLMDEQSAREHAPASKQETGGEWMRELAERIFREECALYDQDILMPDQLEALISEYAPSTSFEAGVEAAAKLLDEQANWRFSLPNATPYQLQLAEQLRGFAVAIRSDEHGDVELLERLGYAERHPLSRDSARVTDARACARRPGKGLRLQAGGEVERDGEVKPCRSSTCFRNCAPA